MCKTCIFVVSEGKKKWFENFDLKFSSALSIFTWGKPRSKDHWLEQVLGRLLRIFILQVEMQTNYVLICITTCELIVVGLHSSLRIESQLASWNAYQYVVGLHSNLRAEIHFASWNANQLRTDMHFILRAEIHPASFKLRPLNSYILKV
jgi:hypothetical protein